ncbi:MAG: NAD-dependent epimerase/dehydratase family protein [Bacteroidia bacterium]|nr:NAD-dependent epimerase/dehydratase family protein [Bacteroidia bacterium]
MKIFVIGGTGFLGSYIVPKLILNNHEVTILTTNEAKIKIIENIGAKGIVGNILNIEEFLPKLPKQDMIIFIAMPFRPGRIGEKKFRQLRQQTTVFAKNAITLAEKLGSILIFTLGTSFKTKGDEIADETWKIHREGLTLIGEYVDPILEDTLKKGTPPLILMLPGQIYGPGGLFMMMVDMMKKGKFRVIGNGLNRIPRIHAEDCANAYIKAVEKLPIGEKFILADDYACTAREFSDCMAECFGKPKPKNIPAFIIRWVLGKYMSKVILMDCRVSNAKAKKIMGWKLKYPTYKEGLKATFEALLNDKIYLT